MANDPPESGLTPEGEAKILAGVDLIGRTGATGIQVRYEDSEAPIVWISVAVYEGHAEAEAALNPLTALMRLCERVVDGGQCTHCRMTTAFYDEIVELLPGMDQAMCICMWDPELKTFRRGCEGD